MIRVLFHYEAGPELRRKLLEFRKSGVEVECCDQADDDRYKALLKEVDVLWHVLRPVEGTHIAAAKKLKLIQKIGVGVNTIDLEAARNRNIAVCNMPGTNSRAVAEMTLMLMLSTLRLQPKLDALCRTGQWTPDDKTRETLEEIGGKTVGLVGMGDIPRILAPMLEAMNARVVYHSRAPGDVNYPYLSLPELLQISDIVSLHIPLSQETRAIMNSKTFATMKSGAVFVNTARGGLVDETALYGALTSGRLKAAGLDVFAEEPVNSDNPLLGLDQVIPAPHIAWLTKETLQRSLIVAMSNTLAVMHGEEPSHRIV